MNQISLISIITRMFATATPLVITGVGGLFGERAGITNIGLEGNILLGAFAAAIGSIYTGNPWIGLLCAVALCTLIGLLHAYLCVTVKLDHVMSGLAINVFAANITVYLLGVLFGSKGNSPIAPKLPSVDLPLLEKIPYLGPIFQNVSVITLMMPVIVVIGWLLQKKMRFGMYVIASGSRPIAATTVGINVSKTQYLSVLFGGFCCGLAGAFLSISYMNMFVRNMSAGKGYIAIAAILFGNYDAVGICLAGLFFGLLDSLQIALQGNVGIPSEFIQCLPYILTILMVASVMVRGRRQTMRRKKLGRKRSTI